MMDRIFPSFDLNRKPPMDDESGTSVARNTRQEERWERRRQSQVKQKPYFDSARDNTFTLNSSGSQSALNVTSPNAHPIPGPTPPIGNHTMSDMKAAAAAFYTSALPSIATGTELSQQHTPAQLNAQQQMHPGASGSGYAPQPYPAPNAPGLRTGPVQGQGQDGDNPLGLGAQQQQHQQQFVHTPGHSNHSTPGNFGQDTFGADSQADGAQGGAAIGSPYTHNLQGTPQPSMHTQQMSSLAYSRDNTGPPTSVSIGGSPAGQEVVSPVVMGTQNISSGHLDNAGSNVGALSEGGAGNNLGNSNHDNETNSRRASAESSNTTTQPNATMNHNQFAAPLYPGSAFPTIAPLQIMSQIAPAPANGNPPSTMQYSHIQPNPNQTTAQSQFTKAQSLSENGPSTDGGMKDIKGTI
ncbi:hypothetical protein SARC_12768 [Sphaeroforma arctica JP610]|uniref:Uncharacterized protein n=1 Tax=Sphaeroforma arctica JP610 TaxID=667725 RepID=A0A0L0FE05_9EUKA|nr:hypothetical protein SARC_12768 [Sphaeroforma arctica JP610]KNC74691.1 hypothetical protein SARC_12768 [Sphaeroforma arctica JP610]|eukprot:XP_014148593.1 hypothetical protein SARC_12768 [Sphaeroforma arctica JP610]